MSDTAAPRNFRQLPQLDKFRFGVEKDGVGFSNLWFADQVGDNIYLGARNARGSVKISLHGTGVCHIKGRAIGVTETLTRWQRRETPASGATRVVSIDFPTDYTFQWKSMERLRPKQPAFFVSAAPVEHAVEFGFFYSREHPDELAFKMKSLGTQIVFFDLPCGEFVIVLVRMLPFDPKRIPQGPKQVSGIQMPLPPGGLPSASMMAWTDPIEGRPLWVTNLQGIRISQEAST